MDNKQIQMLNEPLLDEDCEVNPWAMKELEDAINAMPKTYERLSDDSEWSVRKDQWTFCSNIVASFAKCAVQQSQHGIPIGLENVCKLLRKELQKRVYWAIPSENGEWQSDDISMAELSLCEINKLCFDILYEQDVKEFDAWNEGEDFIDLDALLHNVCLDIRLERRAFKAFNDKFDIENEAQEITTIN